MTILRFRSLISYLLQDRLQHLNFWFSRGGWGLRFRFPDYLYFNLWFLNHLIVVKLLNLQVNERAVEVFFWNFLKHPPLTSLVHHCAQACFTITLLLFLFLKQASDLT